MRINRSWRLFAAFVVPFSLCLGQLAQAASAGLPQVISVGAFETVKRELDLATFFAAAMSVLSSTTKIFILILYLWVVFSDCPV